MSSILYAEIELFCALLLVFFAFKLRGIRTLDRHYYSIVCAFLGAMLVSDAICALLDGRIGVPKFILYAFHIVYIILSMAVQYCWIRFERFIFARRPFTSKAAGFLIVPMCVSALLAISSVATGWIFSISDENQYIRGPLIGVQIALGFGYIVVTVIYALIYYSKATDRKIRHMYLSMSGFGCSTLLASIVDTLLPDIATLGPMATLFLIWMLFILWDSFVLTDRDMLKAAVTYAYPVTVYANLTSNEYHIITNNLDERHPTGERGKYTDLIESIYLRIPELEQDKFRLTFNLDAMISTYYSGQKEVTLPYRSMSCNEILHWNEMKTVFIPNSENDDVLLIMLIKNIDTRMADEAQLQEARRNAEAANRAKTTFLFNMSHDIRTPMNAIIGFTNMAEQNIDNKERVCDCLHKVKYSSEHLLQLINDILDMSRIESGNIRISETPADIVTAVQSIFDMVQSTAADNNIEFNFNITEVTNRFVYADILRVTQILLNIVSNAMKYTKPGGHVDFSMRQLNERHSDYGTYEFMVSDNGIGMSSDFVSHIFDMFSRERTATVSGIEGTGLGMAITKQLVDTMGGQINVDSVPDEGTTVTIVLDFKLRDRGIDEPANEDNLDVTSLKDKRILLVEDNVLNREIVHEILKSAGMKIDEAENGLIAVNMVSDTSNHVYDVILMDIQMPQMDGYEAAKRIRSLNDTLRSKIPIIAMTANAYEEDRDRAFQSGMNDHVSKPIDPEALLNSICKHSL